MPLPLLPREIGDPRLDIHSIFLYLQRIRDQFTNSVVETVTESTFSAEDAQDSIGTILQDSDTIVTNYDDVTPKITFDVKENTSIQKVVVAKNDTVTGNRKQLNFLETGFDQLSFTDDTVNDEIELRFDTFPSRLVTTQVPVTVKNTHAFVTTKYLQVQGQLTLQGDAVLHIL